MDTLTENYSGEKCRKDLPSENLDKADKAGDSYGYLNQQANGDPINGGSLNPLLKIKHLRLSNVNRVIISNLNINSLTNKFDLLKQIVLKYIDILIITEKKLDDSSSNAQFSGFSKPFHFNRKRKGDGVTIYVWKVFEVSCQQNTFFLKISNLYF